jgi:sugar phosphate isomerase/epimerase
VGEQQKTNAVSRRTFLFELAAIGVGTSALASCARGVTVGSSVPRANQIGVQLYTVRDLLDKDFEGTLKRVADIGYKNFEFAGYYNRTPEQIRGIIDRLGVGSPSAHIGANLMRADAAKEIRSAKTIGQSYITLPSYPFPRDGGAAGFKAGAAEFNKWGAMCKDAGIKLAYHNHNAEFAKVDGTTTGMDILLGETDPSLVDFELDLYWAVFADQDPVALFAKYPGRFAMWHVKDMQMLNNAKAMAQVGRGTLNFKSFFDRANASGLKFFFVEHDNAATTGGSLESLQQAYTHLRGILA